MTSKMKAINILTAAFVAAAAPFAAGAYDNVTAVKLATTADNARAVVTTGNDGSTVIASRTADGDAARWVIYHNTELDRHYIVNLDALKFLASDGRNAILTERPTNVILAQRENGGSVIVDAVSGGMIGLPERLAGTNVAIQTDSVSNADPFVITHGNPVALTDEQAKAVAGLCSTKAISEYRVKELGEFVENARKAANPDMAGYIGIPRVDRLAKALEDARPLEELEILYEQALASQYPAAGHYYRLHNISRPAAGSKNNILSLRQDGALVASASPLAPGASGDRVENLALFTFDSDASTPSIAYINATARPGFCIAAEGGLTSKPQAQTMELERRTVTDPYQFRLRRTDKANLWMTLNGEGKLVAYGYEEEPEWWWIEEIMELELPLTAGVANVMLPCAIELPADAKAYAVSSVEAEKGVNLVDIGSVVPAATPVVIVAEGQTALTVAVLPGDYLLSTFNILGGAMVRDQEPGTCFTAVMGKDGKIEFKRARSARRKANEAWLPAPEGMETLTVIPVGNIETTGIEAVAPDQGRTEDAEGDVYYDLQGRRIARPADRGVYINGTTGRVRVR